MILSEVVDIHDVNSSAEKWGDLIVKNCKPFLALAGGKPLYRGIHRSNIGGLATITPRTDRKPMDTKPEVQKGLDRYFEKKYGVKPRTEGLFTTGDSHNAASFGQVCYLFPLGEFKYFWFYDKRFKEVLRDTVRLTRHIRLRGDARIYDREDSEEEQEDLADFISHTFSKDGPFEIRTDNFKQALQSGAEIIVVCRRAYAVPRYIGGDNGQGFFEVHYDTLIHPEDYQE